MSDPNCPSCGGYHVRATQCPEYQPTAEERVALRYCEILGLDPHERVQYPHPQGYAVVLRNERYKVLAEEAKHQMAWHRAIHEEEKW